MDEYQAPVDAGQRMMETLGSIFSIPRSITGDGVRRTLQVLAGSLDRFAVTEVPTGTPVLDWHVPKEWNFSEAWVEDMSGRRVVDSADSNLHVLGYSLPFHGRVSREELLEHLHSNRDHPQWIPFRNSFYDENWGLCVAHDVIDSLTDDQYNVCIDARLEPGHLTYGEVLLPGSSTLEIVLTTYICHPELASELTGMVLLRELAQALEKTEHRFSYRLIWWPATIGPITWLARNQDRLPNIAGGLMAMTLGDRGPFIYKRSRRGNSRFDRCVELALRTAAPDGHILRDFFPWGGDERQMCSPGFNLPFGALSRTPSGEYAEYHSSADGLHLVDENALMASLQLLLDILRIVEANTRITGTVQHGEPQLGRRGLWPSIGAGARVPEDERMALLWVLSLADGNHDLLDVAEQSHMDPNLLNEAAAKLERSGLLGTSLANWHDSDYGDAPAILPTTRAFAHRPRAS